MWDVGINLSQFIYPVRVGRNATSGLRSSQSRARSYGLNVVSTTSFATTTPMLSRLSGHMYDLNDVYLLSGCQRAAESSSSIKTVSMET